MNHVCDHSYPKGSTEANVWKILNLLVMNGQDCPIPAKANYTLPLKLSSVDLTFNEAIPCGDYSSNFTLDSPQEVPALEVNLAWKIDKGSTECTDETHKL